MYRIILLLTATAMLFAEGGPDQAVPGQGAQEAAKEAAKPGSGLESLFPFLLIGGLVLMMWFMVIRPQKKEEKRRKEMTDATKRGDEVVTIGGVHGTVESVGEATIDVRIGKGSESVVVTFNKGAISVNLTNERANSAAKK